MKTALASMSKTSRRTDALPEKIRKSPESLKRLSMEVYRSVASPPGKSTRAVPTSGLCRHMSTSIHVCQTSSHTYKNRLSPANTASPIRMPILSGVCPGKLRATAVKEPILKLSPSCMKPSKALSISAGCSPYSGANRSCTSTTRAPIKTGGCPERSYESQQLFVISKDLLRCDH